ncbi:MAG: hypothetical protein IH599_01755, partial [Bacteroidales bacterium]|nr:hypothetical protein [Bacteroidales bacterium]
MAAGSEVFVGVCAADPCAGGVGDGKTQGDGKFLGGTGDGEGAFGGALAGIVKEHYRAGGFVVFGVDLVFHSIEG